VETITANPFGGLGGLFGGLGSGTTTTTANPFGGLGGLLGGLGGTTAGGTTTTAANPFAMFGKRKKRDLGAFMASWIRWWRWNDNYNCRSMWITWWTWWWNNNYHCKSIWWFGRIRRTSRWWWWNNCWPDQQLQL
jgi:hypothetical protein